MNNWDILTTHNKKEWNDLVNSCAQSDIHFTAEYMQLFEEQIQGNAFLFVKHNSDKSNYLLYPFFKRRINDMKIFSNYEKIIFDIVSPWYFGGPLLSNDTNKIDLLNSFLLDFEKYAQENNIVTEFTRIHPLLSSSNDFIKISKAQYRYDISYIDLKKSHLEIQKNFKKSNRNAITAAKRKGVEIQISNSISALKVFHDLYVKTMSRLNADQSYFFTLSFLEKLLNVLSKNMIIFTAIHEGIPTSSSIFLFKSGIIHYWLSGSDSDYKNLYSNNLLLSEAITWAKENENQTFMLMGGSSEGLRSFKESFSNTKTGFYTLNKIHNTSTYSVINEIVRKQKPGDSKTNFFPYYRS